jgi:hypothetical protein
MAKRQELQLKNRAAAEAVAEQRKALSDKHGLTYEPP